MNPEQRRTILFHSRLINARSRRTNTQMSFINSFQETKVMMTTQQNSAILNSPPTRNIESICLMCTSVRSTVNMFMPPLFKILPQWQPCFLFFFIQYSVLVLNSFFFILSLFLGLIWKTRSGQVPYQFSFVLSKPYTIRKLSQNFSCQMGPPYLSKFSLPMSFTNASYRSKEIKKKENALAVDEKPLSKSTLSQPF